MDESTRETLEDILLKLQTILAEVKEASEVPLESPEKPAEGGLTARGLQELASHEGAVLEAYKDSKGIWTWGIGVTDASGHRVLRYKDNPQTLERVLEIFDWLVRTKYLPDVLKEFSGYELSEAQLAAAVSFHYNTGAIKTASWPDLWKAGKITEARKSFLSWNKPAEIVDRRKKEASLFFDGKWSSDGKVNVYREVNKPSYTPKWSSAKRMEIL